MLSKLIIWLLLLVGICLWAADHFIDEMRKENAITMHRIEKGDE